MPSLRPIVTKLRAELRNGIEELERARIDTVAENVRRGAENADAKLEQDSRQSRNNSLQKNLLTYQTP